MKRFVSNDEFLKGVVCKTDNIVVQKIQSGSGQKRCYVIGNGHSLSVGDNNRVVKHDPFMQKFTPKIKKEYTVYAFYFTFECSGLEESSKEIAEFVNNLKEHYSEIFFVGHSKCGLCLAKATQYCRRIVTLVTISTPYKGAVIADKKAFEKALKFPPFIKLYNRIFSDHNVDRDIAPDSTFIANVQQPVCEKHYNIVSSLNKIQDCRGIIDVFLLFLDRFMKIGGDGVVSLNSQRANSSNCEVNIYCSHASSLEKGIGIIDEL